MKKRVPVWGLMLSSVLFVTGVVHGQFYGSIEAWGLNNNGQCNVPAPNEDFVAIAAGTGHSLGLMSDGTIVAWGANEYGQCDVPTTNAGFVAVAASGFYSLGLKSDGAIVAWGLTEHGQCNVPAPNEGFVAVAAGWGHSMGLKSDGSIVAWGFNNSGQCNIPAPNEGFMAIAAGMGHSLGLRSNGSIVAWGSNDNGECNVPTPNEGFVAITAGSRHSIGLMSNGKIVAWGSNDFGQCNVPTPNNCYSAVAAGWEHSLGLKSDGTIVAWGGNDHGQCNVPLPNRGFGAMAGGWQHSLGIRSDFAVIGFDKEEIIFADTVMAGTTVQQVLNVLNYGASTLNVTNVVSTEPAFSVSSTSFMVSPDGSEAITVQFTPTAAGTFTGWLIFNSNDPMNPTDRVYCRGIGDTPGIRQKIVAWGGNDNGQCNVPAPNERFHMVAAGGLHSLGLKPDGTIVAWGLNDNGQCDIPMPDEGFVTVSAGDQHSLGLKSGGKIVAWGLNDNGQCDVPTPDDNFVMVAAGGNHSLGLKSDGTIVAWGMNYSNQCNVPAPNQDFTAIAAGGYHSLGLKSDGTIVAWGWNDNGQCNVPMPDAGFVGIAAGGNHSLGLKSDGTIVAWGWNDNGQCNIPEPNECFVGIASGWGHSLGLKSDGSIRAWGSNGHGECNIPAPNRDFGIIAAGIYHSLGIRKALQVIAFDPEEIIFSDTLVAGAIARQTLNVLNNGNDPLDVINVVATEPVFSVSSSSFIVAPHSRKAIDVQFAPPTAGIYQGWLIFSSKDAQIPLDSVYCQGIALDYIYLSIPSIKAFPGDTIIVPIQANFKTANTYDSAEIAVGGYPGGLQFIGIDTISTLIGTAEWDYVVNETEGILLTAYAGSQNISGRGVFCRLKFIITGNICTLVPITIESALFNTGEDPVIITDGSVYIQPIPFYGDVDENGLVQAHDAAFILKYLVGTIDTLDCQQFANADVTLDSTVSALDASIILKYVVQLIDSLPWPGGSMLAKGDVSMLDDEIAASQVVEIPLYLNKGDNILSFAGNLDYNPDYLTLTDIIWCSQLVDYTIFDTDQSGEIRFAGAGTQTAIAEGVLVTLVFTVNEGFNVNETIVTLRNLRWNENIAQENVARAKLSLATGLKEHTNQRPTDFVLEQNYPNPFKPWTTIAYQLPRACRVNLTIYNLMGQEIRRLVNDHRHTGYYQVNWDGRDARGVKVSSGVYLYTITAGEFRMTRKMVVMQ